MNKIAEFIFGGMMEKYAIYDIDFAFISWYNYTVKLVWYAYATVMKFNPSLHIPIPPLPYPTVPQQNSNTT